jgi:hypothetical protein
MIVITTTLIITIILLPSLSSPSFHCHHHHHHHHIRDRSLFIAGEGAWRENGWVNKILWVSMGGLNKNSPSQGVGKVKIIKSENTKIFVLFVLLRSNKYRLLYISICKVFHLNLP